MVGRIPVVLVLLTVSLLAPHATDAQPRGNRYFPETGFIVDGAVLAAFNRFGGVPIIGLPISDAMETMCEQRPCTVQWFERTRIEIHHDDGQAYRGRIGADFLAQRGTPWQFGNDTVQQHAAEAPCLAFRETGHVTCTVFLAAWNRYGGTERLGLPISKVRDERYVDGGTGQTVTFRTQWFERAALEDHGDQGVLLRLLGSQTYPAWAEQLLATLINTERANAGLAPLTWNDALAHAARGHNLDLAQHNGRGHIGTDGRDPIARTSNPGLSGFFGGEVVTYDQSPVAAFRSWMQSPAHKEILLYSNTALLGVGYGVVLGPVRGNQWPATVWTADFWVTQ
jgi:uncharacterized protein YkwD